MDLQGTFDGLLGPEYATIVNLWEVRATTGSDGIARARLRFEFASCCTSAPAALTRTTG